MWKIFLFLMANLIAIPSWAAVTGVTFPPGGRNLRLVGGERYIEVKGFMHGTVPSRIDPITNQVATYKTPIKILYPEKATKSNRTAIINPKCYTMQEISAVDSIILVDGVPEIQDMATVNCGAELFTEKFIGSRGYTYVELDWNRYVLEKSLDIDAPINQYSRDDIKEANDAYQILADATSLVKNPPQGVKEMPRADIAIDAAFSGGNMFSRDYFLHKYFETNESDGTTKYPRAFEYDGYLQIAMGPFCLDLNTSTFESGLTPCGLMVGEPDIADVPGPGKVIVYNTEAEVQAMAGGMMEMLMDAPNLRLYEVAGSAHLPKSMVNLEQVDLFADILPVDFRQNPANGLKPLGAMTENLRQWIKNGTLPPPSVRLQGLGEPPNDFYQPKETGILCSSFLDPALAAWGLETDAQVCDHMGNSPEFFPFPVERVGGLQMVLDGARDGNGNALGGIRLPYIEVPLGEYNGLELGLSNELHPDLQPQWQRIIAWELGGFYERFDNGRINSLYRTNKDYVNKVVAAALNAYNQRWITAEDYADYVNTAKNSAIGKQSTYSDADLEAAHGVFF